MRAGSRRRLLLLIVVVVFGGGGGLYLHRERKLDSEARDARETGMAAFDRRDFPIAVEALARFIRRLSPDTLALLRYAQAIRALPNPDAAHVESAIASLRRCVAQDAGNAEARGELLDLYLDVGAKTETIDQADWFLAKDPTDARAVRAKAVSLASMSKFEEALATLGAQVRVETPRLADQLLYLGLLSQLKRPREEILLRAQQVEAANAEDPRFRLVGARALLLVDEAARARQALTPLLALAAADAPFARILLSSLDDAGLAHESLAMLLSLRVEDFDSRLWSELARRLWQAGDPSTLVARFASWTLPLDSRPTSVLGHEALAQARLGRLSDARQRTEVLRRRSSDAAARGWTRLLDDTILADAPSLPSRIAACLRAIELDGTNPQSHFALALAYRDAGEVDLAVTALRAAGSVSPGWAEPIAACAKILAEDGRLPAALGAAAAAESRGSSDPAVGLLLSMLRTAKGSVSRREFAERMISEWARSGRSTRDTFPIRLALAASTGQRDAIASLIQEALAFQEGPEGEVLLACALISRSSALGLEARCLSRYEALYGITPSLALAVAQQFAVSGDAAAGLAHLRKQRAIATTEADTAWQAAVAAYLEVNGMRDEALRAWKSAVASSSSDAGVLRAALDAPSTWSDREFAHEAVEALKRATHISCLWWRVYDARWTLTGPKPSPTEVEQASRLLEVVVKSAPTLVRPRLLLAEAYELGGEFEKALDQLRVVRATQGSSPALELRVARTSLRTGDWSGARDSLQRVLGATSATAATLSSDQRLAIASMFAQLGERSTVLTLLEQGGDDVADLDEVVGRAELYAASGEFTRARRLIESIPKEAENPSVLLFAAAVAEIQGRSEDATRILEQVSRATSDVAARERMLAGHFTRVEDFTRAETHRLRVVEVEAATDVDWTELVACQVLLGKAEEVVSTLSRARSRGRLSTKSDEGELSSELLRIAAARPELRALGTAYARDVPRRAVAAQAIRMLSTMDPWGSAPADRSRLSALAKMNPSFLALQMATVDFLMRRREFGEAISVCIRTATSLPAASEPHRALAYCYRASGRRDLATASAMDWRARASGLSMEADLFLAEQATPSEVVTLLRQHIPRALERGVLDALVLYGRALIRQGSVDEAAATLEPRLSNGVVVTAWVRLAEFMGSGADAKRAVDWLRRDEIGLGAARDPELRVDVAAAWNAVASTTKDEQAREASRSALKSAQDDGRFPAKTWERIGLIHEANGDTGPAERAYRRAVAAEPLPLVAVNNLAMILARSQRASEALGLAEKLVTRGPDVPAFHDTMAFVQVRLGDVDAGIKALERTRQLEPENAEWALRIIQVMIDQNDLKGARTRLQAFQSEYPPDQMSADVRRRWETVVETLQPSSESGR